MSYVQTRIIKEVMIKMTNQQKEDKLMDALKHPSESHSAEISRLIDDTIKKKHKIFCMSDWHLFIRKEKGKPECHKRSNFDEIINNLKIIQPDDLLIYLGDLVDGEFQDKDSLKNVILPMNFNKILVIGNNDLFDVNFYKSCGFKYVVRSFVWHDILFTHCPVKNDNHINVHGHIHGCKRYYVPYTNHVDVGFLDGRKVPVELYSLIKIQPKYSKLIKECPEHFNEGYEHHPSSNMFIEVMSEKGFTEDPYRD